MKSLHFVLDALLWLAAGALVALAIAIARDAAEATITAFHL